VWASFGDDVAAVDPFAFLRLIGVANVVVVVDVGVLPFGVNVAAALNVAAAFVIELDDDVDAADVAGKMVVVLHVVGPPVAGVPHVVVVVVAASAAFVPAVVVAAVEYEAEFDFVGLDLVSFETWP
jgi:hypothetical protein